MKRKPGCLRLIGLFLILSLTALPLVAHAEGAGDVDPQGVKLKALLRGKAQATANTEWLSVCYAEISTGIGAAIWATRLKVDFCRYKRLSLMDYCFCYSKNCKHYDWNPKCLSLHGCPN